MIGVNVCSEEGINKFLVEFEKSSATSYNVLYGDKKTGKKIVIPGYRKCYHNIRKRTKSGSNEDEIASPKTVGKQTNCPAGITFKLKQTNDHEHDENCLLFPLELSLSLKLTTIALSQQMLLSTMMWLRKLWKSLLSFLRPPILHLVLIKNTKISSCKNMEMTS